MVRLGLLALPLLVACTGEIQSALLEGLSPEEQIAAEKWAQKALPVFSGERTKCMTCHDGSMPTAPPYLAGPDDIMRRETLVAFMPRVVNLGAPGSSRMLTVGDHTAMGGGPALLAPEASDCLEWIRAEALARPPVEPIRTAQIVPMVCPDGTAPAACPVNTIDLAGVGPTPITGATITFVMNQIDAQTSYVTNMKIKAGPEGLYIEHPLFETYVGGDTKATPDPIDRLFAIVLNLPANQEMILGRGNETFVGFVPTDPISVRVDVVEPVRPGT